jgi:ABC-type transport system involved in multi-copper enzyme maturation permease subunit
MAESMGRAHAPQLLHYRPWQGTFRSPLFSVWPIARTSLNLILRRKLFWGLYALGMLIFLLFFFGQYLVAWAGVQADEGAPRSGRTNPRELLYRFLPFLNGSGETYRTFMSYQGYVVMVVLAMAGSVLIGNDLRFGSLPYYLSKPLGRRHYLFGKALAVVVFINLMTTLPALILFGEFTLLYPPAGDTLVEMWHNWAEKQLPLLWGVLGYGAVLSVSLSLILLATAVQVKKTVPLIMVWTTLFLFCRVLAGALVDVLRFDPHWRLIDLWNCAYLVGSALLGMPNTAREPEPTVAALVLCGVSLLCLSYLVLRIRAVEVVK